MRWSVAGHQVMLRIGDDSGAGGGCSPPTENFKRKKISADTEGKLVASKPKISKVLILVSAPLAGSVSPDYGTGVLGWGT